MTEPQYRAIGEMKEKHQLLDLMVNHGYAPQNSHAEVLRMLDIYTNLRKTPVNTACRACVFDAARNLYYEHERIYKAKEQAEKDIAANALAKKVAKEMKLRKG